MNITNKIDNKSTPERRSYYGADNKYEQLFMLQN